MAVSLGVIAVGKCYLVNSVQGARVRRVLALRADGLVQYEGRLGRAEPGQAWPLQSTMGLQMFAVQAEREVPCDWSLEADQQEAR